MHSTKKCGARFKCRRRTIRSCRAIRIYFSFVPFRIHGEWEVNWEKELQQQQQQQLRYRAVNSNSRKTTNSRKWDAIFSPFFFQLFIVFIFPPSQHTLQYRAAAAAQQQYAVNPFPYSRHFPLHLIFLSLYSFHIWLSLFFFPVSFSF